jgi:hypothetical protein
MKLFGLSIFFYFSTSKLYTRFFGVAQASIHQKVQELLTTVIDPRHYTKAELKRFKFPLITKEKTKVAKWRKKTGGIGGKAYGLQSESMPRERLRTLIRDLVVGVKRGKQQA